MLWLLTGLLIGMSGSDVRPGAPVHVVLAIAAVGAFAVGVFALALAAGTLGRSDACRIASAGFQIVSASVIVVACVRIVEQGGSITVTLDPTAGPEFVVRLGFVLVMLGLAVTTGLLLVCRRSAFATGRR
jgi:hypothetical protein